MAKLKIYCDNSVIDTEMLAEAIEKTLGQRIRMYIDLAFVSEEEIRSLNRENRNVDSVTDVLSFPMLDGIRGKVLRKKDCREDYDEDERAVFLGSIAICTERAKEQAEEFGHGFKREAYYLTVHGALHLFGYDHVKEEDKAQMRELEEKILSGIGVER